MQSIILIIMLIFSTSIILQIDKDVFSQTFQNENESSIHVFNTLVTNSLNISAPVYQAYSGTFLGSKNLSSGPPIVSEDYAIEKAVMKNVGNVTNNMTFINTHLSDGTIQSAAKGTITSEDGQNISWISSDIGIINDQGELFHGIIQFDITNSSSFSFFSNATGIDRQTPEIKRTIWLIEK
ncbi:hypothetical protein [Candidatus Nitrosocosmicus arcticus]|uniref:Uncharacterized protein n=1 Tax=Candidatus Nitrosocosmicus arcticus TaxID=2035267 RepID=A0A557SRU8_9ARCH|nr:hypothetical protein [Candidatus Nitrosocosmicus arcticus]TVP39319.1 hypothetical protein NARC_160032 [Candidatus Nitrosocosmicus arcticus]